MKNMSVIFCRNSLTMLHGGVLTAIYGFFYLASFVCPVNLLFGVPETYITYAIVMMLIAFLVFLMIKYPDKRLLEQDVESGN